VQQTEAAAAAATLEVARLVVEAEEVVQVAQMVRQHMRLAVLVALTATEPQAQVQALAVQAALVYPIVFRVQLTNTAAAVVVTQAAQQQALQVQMEAA